LSAERFKSSSQTQRRRRTRYVCLRACVIFRGGLPLLLYPLYLLLLTHDGLHGYYYYYCVLLTTPHVHMSCVQQKTTYALLVATCDESAKLWVDIEILKARSVWSAGWLQKETLLRLMAEADETNTEGQEACAACGGCGTVACRYCCDTSPIQLY
jgi:hypothetical protein